MPTILSDPHFLAAAIVAVILVGLSKGGLGGSMGVAGVPVLALAVSPLQAAAILLPILIAMDLVSLWAWRGKRDRALLSIMIPSAIVGIGIGWLTAALVTADMVRLILGAVVLAFLARSALAGLARSAESRPHRPVLGWFWGVVSGFTSFVAHAGGPPYQVYALPLRLDPKIYTGTTVVVFATINAVKLVPYFALGQFDAENLAISAALMPLAPLATLAGAAIVKRMRPEIFYPFTYATVFLIAIKLVWDGGVALASSGL